jgi:hypothetical protein
VLAIAMLAGRPRRTSSAAWRTTVEPTRLISLFS